MFYGRSGAFCDGNLEYLDPGARIPPSWQVVALCGELARFVVGTVLIVYHGSIEAIVARLQPLPWLVWIVRFLDAAVG